MRGMRSSPCTSAWGGALARPGARGVVRWRIDRFGHHQQRGGPVPLGVRRLLPGVGVQGEAGAVERRVGIVLTRLVIEDEHRLAPHVHAGVVVVAELRCRDAVAGEDDVERQLDPGRGSGKATASGAKRCVLAGATHRNHGPVTVEAQSLQVERLQIGVTVRRLQPRLRELAGDEPRCGLGPGVRLARPSSGAEVRNSRSARRRSRLTSGAAWWARDGAKAHATSTATRHRVHTRAVSCVKAMPIRAPRVRR